MSKHKKIVQVIGTRPNIVKFINITGEDVVVWTGQHFSPEMGDSLLKELGVPISQSFANCDLGEMTKFLMGVMRREKPACVVVYGDTRTTLAGALAADEYDIPIAHVEAGCRVYDMERREERIRRMVDQISTYLFCVNDIGRERLKNEGVLGKVFVVGDLHYDKYCQRRPHCGYTLLTLHRAENVDNKERLQQLLKAVEKEGEVYFPVHPRTKVRLKAFKIKVPKNVKLMEPLKYENTLQVIRNAKMVYTDSGGVSREAFFSGTPVRVLGKSEWKFEINCFGDGRAGERIREILLKEV